MNPRPIRFDHLSVEKTIPPSQDRCSLDAFEPRRFPSLTGKQTRECRHPIGCRIHIEAVERSFWGNGGFVIRPPLHGFRDRLVRGDHPSRIRASPVCLTVHLAVLVWPNTVGEEGIDLMPRPSADCDFPSLKFRNGALILMERPPETQSRQTQDHRTYFSAAALVRSHGVPQGPGSVNAECEAARTWVTAGSVCAARRTSPTARSRTDDSPSRNLVNEFMATSLETACCWISITPIAHKRASLPIFQYGGIESLPSECVANI